MKYLFNFRNQNQPAAFNRERLLLAAIQKPEQLYYMLDTQYSGIYRAEAGIREKDFGPNSVEELLEKSECRMLCKDRNEIEGIFGSLSRQKIVVFRRRNEPDIEACFEQLVPGDVISLSKGDFIPADIRIIYSKGLRVDQSMYTDEEGLDDKCSTYLREEGPLERITDLPNICFLGTQIKEGLARGVVVNTGRATYLGYLLLL